MARDWRQLHPLLLGVGKAGDALAFNQILTIHAAHLHQRRWRMADRRHWLARLDEGFDQGDGGRVAGQVPQRPMASGVEHRIEVRCRYLVQLAGVGQQCLGFGIVLETLGHLGLSIRRITFRIQRRLATLG